jgi:hypothetical protein
MQNKTIKSTLKGDCNNSLRATKHSKLSSIILSCTLLILMVIAFPPTAFGQNSSSEMKPTKYENVTWYGIEQIALKPGKYSNYMNLIKKYYAPVGKAVGEMPVMILEHRTGPWDLTIIWRMKDGPESLDWKTSPMDVAFHNEFLKQFGKDKLMEIQKEAAADIDHGSFNIAMQEDIFGHLQK